jgi:hypothetical protein
MSGGRPARRQIQPEERPELIAGVILRSQSGESEVHIAEAMGLTKHQVRQLKASPEYLDIIKKQKEEAEKRIVSHVVSNLEDMAPLFLEGMKKNLAEGDPSTLRLFVEMIGLKAKESEQQQVAGITVIMPGSSERTVDAEYSTINPEEK